LYSSFYEATQNGMPVLRSLAIDNTHDKNIYASAFQNQFLSGPSIMVNPVEGGKDFMKVYFPQGSNWYDLYNDEIHAGGKDKMFELGLSKLPVFVKASAIIPMQSLVQSTSIKPVDTLFVHIYNGAAENNYVYYEDDGNSFDNEKGAFYKRNISFNPTNKTISFGNVEGSYSTHFKNVAVILHGFNKTNSVNVNGVATSVEASFTSLLNPISKFDPIGNENPVEGSKTQTIRITNSNSAIRITY
jgi:alpha-glucosidase